MAFNRGRSVGCGKQLNPRGQVGFHKPMTPGPAPRVGGDDGGQTLGLPVQARLHPNRRAAGAGGGPSAPTGCASWCRNMTPPGCTMTCGWSWMACSSRGRSRGVRRWTRTTSASPSRWRTTRSTTATGRARSPRGNTAATRCSSGTAGYWSPQGTTAEEGLASGDLKFTLDGGAPARQLGARPDEGLTSAAASGTNWLLIKHRDEHAQRRRRRRAAGRRPLGRVRPSRWRRSPPGRAGRPKPFMAGKAGAATVAKDAVWDSNVGLAPTLRAEGKTTRKEQARKAPPAAAAMPDVHRAAALPVRRAAARPMRGMGARDQVRRLPRAAARRRG